MSDEGGNKNESTENVPGVGFTQWAIGFKPTSTLRNIAVGLLYIFFWYAGAALLLIGLWWSENITTFQLCHRIKINLGKMKSPRSLVGSMGGKFNSTIANSPFARLPGTTAGGWKSGAAMFGYLLFALLLISAATGGSSSAGSENVTETTAGTSTLETTVTSTELVTSTPTVTQTSSPTDTSTQTVTSTPTYTQTATDTTRSTTTIPQSSGEETIERAAQRLQEGVRSETNIDLSVRVDDELFGQDDLYGIYVSTALSQSESGEEIGKIVGAYISIVSSGYPTGNLNVDAYNVDGDKIGSWTVRREWAEQYLNGELTEDEVIQKVFQTIEIV